MYIEVLVILLTFFVFICWSVWYFISKKTLKWRYKPENDKGRLAEESRRNSRVEKPSVHVSRPLEPGARELLQTTDSPPIRQNSSRPRNPFKRRRK